ncbi:hypothetical protein MXB_5099, partial [Myxobolus squamalis]
TYDQENFNIGHDYQNEVVQAAHPTPWKHPTYTPTDTGCQSEINSGNYGNQYYGQPVILIHIKQIKTEADYAETSQFNNKAVPGYGAGNAYVENYNQPRYPTVQNLAAISEDKRKINSDAMPHAITVYRRDYEKYYGNTIDTTAYEASPPLISTANIYYTGYKNSTPNFIRSSLYSIPNSSELLKKCAIPFCLAITPFSKQDTCRRCRAYINPFVQFLNGGKNFQCNICDCVNDVPEHYFCNLDQTGTRLDYMNRPELLYGSYDCATNDNYCRNNVPITNPVYIFMLDVSYSAVSSGLLKQVTSTLSNIISSGFFDSCPTKNGIKIAIMAYDTQIYVFCPKSGASEMEVVFDVSEPFISSMNTFIVDPIENKQNIIALLNKIPEIFENNKTIDVLLGPAIDTALDAIISIRTCAKFFIFHGNMPSFDAPGKLIHQNERSKLGGDDEKKTLSPQNPFYSLLATKCVDNGVGIDFFCAELVYEDKISKIAYFQFALLYTSTYGTRLIRVHNIALNVTESINDIFKSTDQDTVAHFLFKNACKNLFNQPLNTVKQDIITQLVKILASYRQNCASNSSPLQLIMPEYVKLLPLYVNSMLNSETISGTGDISPDDKSFALHFSHSCTLRDTNSMLYPRLFDILSIIESPRIPIENYEGYSVEYLIPNGVIQIRDSYERLDCSRIYLLENGINMFLWIGKKVNSHVISLLFGVECSDQFIGLIIDHLPAIDSDLSRSFANLISQIRKLREKHLRIYICQQEDKSEYYFKRYLCEDRGCFENSTSYVEFLCLIFQEIRKLLND